MFSCTYIHSHAIKTPLSWCATKRPLYFRYLILRKSRKYYFRISRALPVYRYMLATCIYGPLSSAHIWMWKPVSDVLRLWSSFSHLASATGFFHGTLLVSCIGETLDDLNTAPPVLISSTRNRWLVIKKADAWNQNDSQYILQTLIKAQMTCLSEKL